jgi:ABC-type multidrug transport system ATPase subunit
MKNLVQLAQKGMSIVTTIHQPSSDVWDLFDKLCLLVEGSFSYTADRALNGARQGNVVYYGPAKAAIQYFGALGHECPQFSNPADYFIGLINTDFEGHADVPRLIEGISTCTFG